MYIWMIEATGLIGAEDMNERITEDIIRNHLKKDIWYDGIHIEEQKSKTPRIDNYK